MPRLAALVALVPLVSGFAGTRAGPLRSASGSRPPHVSPHAFLSGHYPVAFVLCDFSTWHYEPNTIAYYQKLWTQQGPAGTFSSLADYFHDVSFGQLDLKGSRVLGWFHMSVNPLAWYRSVGAVNADRVSTRWLDCVNAAEANGADFGSKQFRAVVVVTPSVQSTITGTGLAAEPQLTTGQTVPPPETMTVKSTKGWPPAPFLISLPSTKAFPFGENVRVSKVSGNTLTVYRGYDEGVKQLPGPFAALPAGGTVVVDSDDDFADVGPQVVYEQQGAQPCTGPAPVPPDTFCPKIFYGLPPSPAGSYETLRLGIANLFAGDGRHGGNVTAGVGDSAHEVGHTTGYDHSRTLTTSTTDYNDCYDQMSYNACGLPGFPGEAGPPDGVIGYDAINLEFHGWVPSKAIYNLADRHLERQVTITLHALSDPNALKDLGRSHSARAYLDAQIPAKVKIEDISPNNKPPTSPPTCTGAGYGCATSRYYTVEYRQLYGFDQSLPRVVPGEVGGVTLHLYAPDPKNPGGNISYLVNAYPGQSTSSGGPVLLPHSAFLQPGDDYADPARHAFVAVNSFDKSKRTATVTVGSAKFTPKLTYPGARNGTQAQPVTLSAKLTVDGAPVPGQLLRFNLAGQGCGPVLTGTGGRAACQVTDAVTPGLPHWVTASFAGSPVYASASAKASFGAIPGPVTVPLPTMLPPTTTTVGAATVVTVTTGVPMTYTFTLSTAMQPTVVSDRPAIELTVPAGPVRFNVTNPYSNILSHNFEVCSAPLPGPVRTLAAVQALPNSCSGASTPVLAPGSARATITVDFTISGAYEYLSTVGGSSGDAFSGMKGVLNVT